MNWDHNRIEIWNLATTWTVREECNLSYWGSFLLLIYDDLLFIFNWVFSLVYQLFSCEKYILVNQSLFAIILIVIH